jgi:hypothetical protein
MLPVMMRGWTSVSDQELTRSSGFLNRVQPGDVVLADRGFLIEDELAFKRCFIGNSGVYEGEIATFSV